jgi:hypothetical protein
MKAVSDWHNATDDPNGDEETSYKKAFSKRVDMLKKMK